MITSTGHRSPSPHIPNMDLLSVHRALEAAGLEPAKPTWCYHLWEIPLGARPGVFVQVETDDDICGWVRSDDDGEPVEFGPFCSTTDALVGSLL